MPAMAWQERKRLLRNSEKNPDSISQLESYVSEPHVINFEYLKYVRDNIKTLSTLLQIKLPENSGNIVSKMKTLISLEEARGASGIKASEKEKKGAVKKSKKGKDMLSCYQIRMLRPSKMLLTSRVAAFG